LYVLRVDAARNEVVVGRRGRGLQNGCLLEDPRLALPLEEAGTVFTARIRSAQKPFPLRVERRGAGSLEARFEQPQEAVAPGQSLVLYLEDVLIGGGSISRPAA
jgi:tRNA-specific 2-thiouridylase